MLPDLDQFNVSTPLAVAFLVRDGITEEQAREAIYRWCHLGWITNHGSVTRGRALWNLGELKRATWPKTNPPKPIDLCPFRAYRSNPGQVVMPR